MEWKAERLKENARRTDWDDLPLLHRHHRALLRLRDHPEPIRP